MSSPVPSPVTQGKPNSYEGFWFSTLAFLALVTFCAGGVPLWGRIVFLFGTGVMLLKNPPKHRLPLLQVLGLSLFVLSHLLSLLPVPSFLRPDWWQVATGDYLFELPSTFSAQPLIALERTFSALAAVAWLALVSGHRLENDTRRHLLKSLALGGAAVAALVSVGNLFDFKNPLADQSQVFSLFPNRNQTGLVLAVACTISFGLGLRSFHYRKTGEAVFSFALAGLCFASTLTLQGRAAPLLAVIGCLLITCLSGSPRDLLRLTKIVIPLALLAGSAVFIFGGDIAMRLQGVFEGSGASDFRVLLMRDTFGLVLDQPVAGVGGGSFHNVFPIYRNESLTSEPVLHPESDWLWFIAEHGALGLFAGLVLTASAFGFLSFQQKNRGETTINIAAVAFILIWLHAFVDGPFHRPGTLLLAVVCLALARHLNDEPRRMHSLPRRLWQGLGCVLLAVSLFWLAALSLGRPWHSSLALSQSRLGTSEVFLKQPPAELRQRLETALRFSPLDAQAHFDLGRLLLLVENDPAAAEMSYLRARLLDPHAADRFLQEGLDWAPTHPERAISAWREALLGQSPYGNDLVATMARLGTQIEAIRGPFERLTHTDQKLRYQFLIRLDYPELKRKLPEDFALNPGLWGFSENPEENQVRRKTLLRRAVAAGLGPEVFVLLARQIELRSSLWPFFVSLAPDDASRTEAARLAYAKVIPPSPPLTPSPASLDVLRQEFAADPSSPAKLIVLVEALREERHWNEILTALALHPDQPPSATLAYFRAEALLRLNRTVESWRAWDSYISLSRLLAD